MPPKIFRWYPVDIALTVPLYCILFHSAGSHLEYICHQFIFVVHFSVIFNWSPKSPFTIRKNPYIILVWATPYHKYVYLRRYISTECVRPSEPDNTPQLAVSSLVIKRVYEATQQGKIVVSWAGDGCYLVVGISNHTQQVSPGMP